MNEARRGFETTEGLDFRTIKCFATVELRGKARLGHPGLFVVGWNLTGATSRESGQGSTGPLAGCQVRDIGRFGARLARLKPGIDRVIENLTPALRINQTRRPRLLLLRGVRGDHAGRFR
jgi:hypothetical protein